MKREKDRTSEKKKGRGIIRLFRWGALSQAALFLLLGLLLVLLPNGSVSVLSYVAGGVLCAFGVFLIASAFLENGGGVLRIAAGAAFIAFAIWLFVQPGNALKALFYVLMGALVLRGILGIFGSLAAMRKGGRAQQAEFFAALIVAIAAFVLFFPPVGFSLQCLLLGSLSIFDGALELVVFFRRIFFKPKEGTGEKKGKDGKSEKDGKNEKAAPAPAETAEAQIAEEPPKKGRKKAALKVPAEAPAPAETAEAQIAEEPPEAPKAPRRRFFRAKKRETEEETDGN